MPKKKNANGLGSVFFREDKNLWVAVVSLPNRKRKYLYGNTQKEVITKKKEFESKNFITQTMNAASYLDYWINHHRQTLKPSTIKRYVSVCRTHLKPFFGHYNLDKITPLLCQEFFSKQSRYSYAVFSKAMKQAVAWHLIPFDPTAGIVKPKDRKKEMCIWDKSQLSIFINAAKNDRYFCLFLFAIFTGCRQGEIIGLKWSDFHGNYISINRSVKEISGDLIINETPKTSKSRRLVYVPQVVIESLPAMRGEFIFTDTNGGLIRAGNLVKRHFKKIIESTNLPEIRFHDLRHIHASLCLDSGMNIKEVSARLGHSSIKITGDIYSHLFFEEDKESRDKLDLTATELFFS